MLNISFSYPGKNKWISIHRDLLRDFVLDNENKVTVREEKISVVFLSVIEDDQFQFCLISEDVQ